MLMRSGFLLKDLFGNDYMPDGLSYKQMNYFYNACVSVDAKDNDHLMMAFARVMSSEEGQKQIQKELNRMRQHAANELEKD